ncbi:hypothetical protein GRF29_185g66664, partial [Pseudopithomyces chartarum]
MIMQTAAMNASYSEYKTTPYTSASLSMESFLSTKYVTTHGPIKSLPFIPTLDCEAISVYDSKRADDKQPVPVMQPMFYDHTPSTSANSIWITLTSTLAEGQSLTAAGSKPTESSNQQANTHSEQKDDIVLLSALMGLLFGFIV